MNKENLILAELYKDGYTSIPNYYFDSILPTLTLIEDRILQVILRKTLGYQKTKDNISISQLITLTKLAKSSIQKAIKSLQDKELIFVEKNEKSTSHISSTYEININKFYNSNKKTIPRKNTVEYQTVPSDGIVTVPRNGNTKERVKIKRKENIYIKATASSFSNKEKSIESCLRLTDQEKEVYINQHGQDIFDKCYTKIKTWLENTEETKRKNFDYCFKAWALTAVIKDEQILNSFQKGSKKDNTKTNRDYFDDFKMNNFSLCKNIISNDLCVADSLAQNKIHFSIDHKEFVKKLNELVNGNQESKILRFKGS